MMTKKVVLILFIVITNLSAQKGKIEFTEYDLPNGLHVILHQDNSTPIVATSVFYHVGSKNEHPERTGFAHFFEHLMFEGSDNIPRGKFMNIVESNGGTLNATTDNDRTFYYEVLPSNQLELALWLEAERMLHLKIDSIGVETQRKVVKEERKQRLENQPYGSIMEETFRRAYKVHPYRWTPIGSSQYIDLAKYNEFIDFYKNYYVPNNSVLTIAGDINIEKTKELVKKYFADIQIGKNKIVRPDKNEPELGGETRDVVYDNIQLPLVLMAYRIPSSTSQEAYQIEMLSSLLAAGQSSRIYKELVDKKQKAVAAGCFPMLMEDSGLLLIYAIANAGVTAEELEGLLQIEIDKVKMEKASDKEFAKLKNMQESQFVNQASSMMGIASSLPSYYVFQGNTNLINTEIEKYLQVTSEQVKDAAAKYLNNNNRVVLYYLPKSAKPNQN